MIHQGDLVQILLRRLEERRFSLIVGALIQPLREHRHIALADGAKDGAAVDTCVRSCLPGGRFGELDQDLGIFERPARLSYHSVPKGMKEANMYFDLSPTGSGTRLSSRSRRHAR